MKVVAFTLPLILATTLMSGCTLVKVSEAGKRVNIVPADQVSHCTKIGATSSTVLDNIVGIPRNREKVQKELDRLAQDQAVLIHANTLVRRSIVDGTGNYDAYNCQ